MNIQYLIWDDFFAKELPNEGFTVETVNNEYFVIPFQKSPLPSTQNPSTSDRGNVLLLPHHQHHHREREEEF